jgi:acyl carrier protein
VKVDGMPDGHMGLTRQRLVGLVAQILEAHAVVRPVAADESLTEAGLSSIDMAQLMLAVEAEFDVVIPIEDITPENFRSVATIAAMIARMSSGAAN